MRSIDGLVWILMTTSGCTVVVDHDPQDAGLPVPDAPPPTDAPPSSGSCRDLTPRTWQGPQGCYQIGPLGQLVTNELVTVWGTQPSLICAYLPSDGRVGPCGPLVGNNAFYCPVDNTISWDIQFMNWQFAQWGDFAPVTIAAHEWGHRNQAQAGLLNRGRSTFQNEQHADCQAGVFAAIEESRGLLEMGDVMESFNSLCAGGGASGWFDPTSHGTCQERILAFQHGYTTGGQRLAALCSSARLETMLAICAN